MSAHFGQLRNSWRLGVPGFGEVRTLLRPEAFQLAQAAHDLRLM